MKPLSVVVRLGQRDPQPNAAGKRWLGLVALATFPILLALASSLTAPSDARLRQLVAVGWVSCHTLLFVGWLLLYYRWTLSRGEASGWLAVIALSGAIYASGCTFRLYLIDDATVPLSDPLGADLVMACAWLVLLRKAARSTTADAPAHPLVLGLAISAAGLALHTALDVMGFPGAGGTPARTGFVVVLAVVAAFCLREVARADYLRVAVRRRLVVAGGLVIASRVVAPTLPAAASGQSAAAVVLAVFAAAVFCNEAVSMGAQRRSRAAVLADEAAQQTVASDHEEQMHEVRASLAGIASAVHLLSSPDAHLPDSGRAHFAEMLESEVARLERLLDHTWVEPPRVHDLDELIEPVIMSRRLSGQMIQWEKSGHRVWCVRDPVAEALNILLVNAHKHAPDSPVTVEVLPSHGQVRLLVSDEGPGISPPVRDALFTRRIRGALSNGQGIGLQLAHRLVASQGGTLSFDGVQRRPGAVFELTLPSPIIEGLQ